MILVTVSLPVFIDMLKIITGNHFFHILLYPSELTNAYNVLRNLTSRREYDKEIGTYFTMRSTKVKQTEEKVLRLTDEMLEIDMKGIRQVLYVHIVRTLLNNYKFSCMSFSDW